LISPQSSVLVLVGREGFASHRTHAVILMHKTNIRLAVILLHVVIMVRKQILGDWERRILVAYLKGERLKGYTALLSHIRKMGLRAIIEGCEKDLGILKQLAVKESEGKHGGK
jgi:hypothetical protein